MADLNDQDRASLTRLKAAVTGGYYRTESREDGEPLQFPWQNRTCRDCAFFTKSAFVAGGQGTCRVWLETRQEMAPTCRYHDLANRAEGQEIIDGKRPRVRPT